MQDMSAPHDGIKFYKRVEFKCNTSFGILKTEYPKKTLEIAGMALLFTFVNID